MCPVASSLYKEICSKERIKNSPDNNEKSAATAAKSIAIAAGKDKNQPDNAFASTSIIAASASESVSIAAE